MSTTPVVHSANLSSPSIVNVGHAATINVRPRRTVVDYRVSTDIDLTNVDSAIQIVAASNRRTVANSIAVSDTTTVANSAAWAEGFVHAQKVANSSRAGASTASRTIDVRASAVARTIGGPDVWSMAGTATEVWHAWACGRAIRQSVTWPTGRDRRTSLRSGRPR